MNQPTRGPIVTATHVVDDDPYNSPYVFGRYQHGEEIVVSDLGHRWHVQPDSVRPAPWWLKLAYLFLERRNRGIRLR